MTKLTINGHYTELEVDASTPLLWVIREQIG
ncbi:MAG: aerobic-type carbon monoxide dehydrogenase small subunit (CoxS/CutS family), partial [Psychromonas sp.]